MLSATATPTGPASRAAPANLPEPDTGLDLVTGAFSYSGRAIAAELTSRGRRFRTLTGHLDRAASTGDGIDVRPFDFGDPVGLARSLKGVTTLYNTYWVRFARGRTTHEVAVANSRALFHAARRAGVQRIVHVSITHPSLDSPYPYFRGKAVVEQSLAETGLPFAIVRPAILFGGDGVLINNIAWLLRRLPVFALAGSGDYRIRAVHIDDLARICCGAGERGPEGWSDEVIDAVGPENPTFKELVGQVAAAVGSRSRIVPLPALLVPLVSRLLGWVLRDVLLTTDELRAMMDGLADTDGPATGEVRLSEWLTEHGDELGRSYANELNRHY